MGERGGERGKGRGEVGGLEHRIGPLKELLKTLKSRY